MSKSQGNRYWRLKCKVLPINCNVATSISPLQMAPPAVCYLGDTKRGGCGCGCGEVGSG